MDVSIIIVNYNTLGLTSDCIESIVDKTSDLEYEIMHRRIAVKPFFHRIRA